MKINVDSDKFAVTTAAEAEDENSPPAVSHFNEEASSSLFRVFKNLKHAQLQSMREGGSGM